MPEFPEAPMMTRLSPPVITHTDADRAGLALAYPVVTSDITPRRSRRRSCCGYGWAEQGHQLREYARWVSWPGRSYRYQAARTRRSAAATAEGRRSPAAPTGACTSRQPVLRLSAAVAARRVLGAPPGPAGRQRPGDGMYFRRTQPGGDVHHSALLVEHGHHRRRQSPAGTASDDQATILRSRVASSSACCGSPPMTPTPDGPQRR
jgi:hypothetical protein